MADREHRYQVTVEWTGNKGKGTETYRAYERKFTVAAAGKADIAGSSDPAFLGDAARWNPEEMLLASTSACHKLWYLHLCAEAGISVESYHDQAEGTMLEAKQGRFTQIVLKPQITLRAGDDIELAKALHHQAHEQCFIANSLNFPVLCEPQIKHA
ncbi:OsmC family protein [Kalamiella sp. sgz302252]|uniref:OsmC family protein n=1 Tax=Pantoea sp. sgz302252 TaxID=3341827 RepID=UPI0036D33765